ncbi:MAG: hypothetical protein SF052_08950 [Bacteroidia bacterium]|nr:hypothetical protein [Bacteroidia bacterium]
MIKSFFLLQTSRVIHLWDLIFDNPANVTPKMVDNLKLEVYFSGVLFAILFLGIAMLIAFLIPHEPGKNPTDPGKRRIGLLFMGILVVVLMFVISLLITSDLTGKKAAELQQAALISVAISGILYFVLAFVMSKVFRKTKLGTWFPSKK